MYKTTCTRLPGDGEFARLREGVWEGLEAVPVAHCRAAARKGINNVVRQERATLALSLRTVKVVKSHVTQISHKPLGQRMQCRQFESSGIVFTDKSLSDGSSPLLAERARL